MDAATLLHLLDVWLIVETVHLDAHQQGQIAWSWEKDGLFSARSAYAAKFAALEASPMAAFTWTSQAPLRCRFFVWLALKDR